MDLFHFIPGYTTTIYETGREPALIMLLAFIVTYLITRGYTRMARKTGWGSTIIGGVHAHHMVYGMILAFSAAAVMFGFLPTSEPVQVVLAGLFGIGASLVLDEFALFFHLEDVYWEKEGRKSVDAVVLAAAFGLLFLLQINPLSTESSDGGWILFTTICINLLFALVAALKGKIYLAIFGVFIPAISQVGAIRLAEPSSVWARKYYRPTGKKMKRSVKRYERYERRWRHRKERAWDIIGGKPGRPPIQAK